MEYPDPDNPNKFFVNRVKAGDLCTFHETRSHSNEMVIDGSANEPGETETETITVTTVIVRTMTNKQTS